VPEVVEHLLTSKAQDGASDRHLAQLRSVLRRFAAAHPVPILDVSSPDIDTWLRGFNVSLTSRNSMLVYRELTTEAQADQWFAIVPKPDQWANTYAYDYKTRTVTLPVQAAERSRTIRAPRVRIQV